jgi:hypothetical protein
LGDRLTAGQWVLVPLIGVRIPVSQPMKKYSLLALVLVLLLVLGGLYFLNTKSKTPKSSSVLSESEARVIAEKTCIKGGESLSSGTYNENSKTWWFDANLNAAKPGCNPACVVSVETKQAEINWRCTGLIVPEKSSEDLIRELLIDKYPKYAKTLTIKMNKETENNARGSVSFVEGEAGGIFLAAKVNGVWQIVYDGNGQIPCTLSSYGFPKEMLSDCAQ